MGLGLSILVPVYNWNVNAFIVELHKQASLLKIPFEILVYDDASDKKQPTTFDHLPFVKYQILTENIGRSKIRNLLASHSKYDVLLFLDGDSYPKHSDFLDQYLKAFNNKNTILCGGTAYNELLDGEEPTLRWVYGKEREEGALVKKGFASNNFLMDKTAFMSVQFDENIKGYGHEDTLFGIECEKNGFSIETCYAPLLHLGLEADDVFIRKTKEGVRNLHKLYSQNKVTKEHSKLIEFHEKLKFRGLIRVALIPILPVLHILVTFFYNLRAFDILKWYWFSSKSIK